MNNADMARYNSQEFVMQSGETADMDMIGPGPMGDLAIIGSDDIDEVSGGPGNDLLVGGGDKDRLIGGDGDDILVGGGLRTEFFGIGIDVNLMEDTPSRYFHFDRPHPSFFADILSGGAGDDLLIGGSWNDKDDDLLLRFDELTGRLSTAELELGSLDDKGLLGFNNFVWGGTGDDTLIGANGLDQLGGGAGDDIIYGFDGADIIFGGAGNDIIFGGAGDPELFHREAGGSFNLVEEIYGGAGNDVIFGEGGVDHIYGGDGNDRIFGGSGGATVGSGDKIDGTEFLEILRGGAGDDFITGDEGDDMIFGDDDNDTLQGNAGDDTLTGGAGADQFLFHEERGGVDIVTDFDVSQDSLALAFVDNNAEAEAFLASGTEMSINGQSGLFIDFGDGSGVLLAGLTVDDIGSVDLLPLSSTMFV